MAVSLSMLIELGWCGAGGTQGRDVGPGQVTIQSESQTVSRRSAHISDACVPMALVLTRADVVINSINVRPLQAERKEGICSEQYA